MGTPTRLSGSQVASVLKGFSDSKEETLNIHERILLLEELENFDAEYIYDTKGNIEKELIYDTATPRNLLKEATFSYDTDGNVTGETVLKNGMTVTKTFNYDAAGDLTSIQVRRSDVV